MAYQAFAIFGVTASIVFPLVLITAMMIAAKKKKKA